MYIPDGERFIVFASNAGAAKHPDWYHNLVARHEVTVEVGTDVFEGIARVSAGAERQRLWSKVLEGYPFFADHQGKISREIPVVALERRST
jgi:deazaflavin-dependent oxidoreductase (nitroreductase family)